MKRFCLPTVAVLAALATSAQAATVTPVVTVSDPATSLAYSFDAGGIPGAAAAAFEIGSDLTGVTIDAEYDCIAAACTVSAFLVTEFGPLADLGNVVASASLSGASPTIFEDLSLAADTYTLILASATGAFAWARSETPTVENTADGSAISSLLSFGLGFNAAVPFQSVFSEDLTSAALYSVQTVVAPPPPSVVPLPQTASLLAGGLVLLGFARRRGRRRG